MPRTSISMIANMVTVSFPCPFDRLSDVTKMLETLASNNLDLKLPINLLGLLGRVEGLYIERAMKVSEGNVSQAAKLLGIKRTTLFEKLRRKNAMHGMQI